MLWSISNPVKLKEGLLINGFVCIQQANKPSGSLSEKSISPIPNGKMCDKAPTAQYEWYVLLIWHLLLPNEEVQVICLGLFSSLYPYDLDDLLDGHPCILLLNSCVASLLLKWKHQKKKKNHFETCEMSYSWFQKLPWNLWSLENICMSYIHVDARKYLPCSSHYFYIEQFGCLTAQLVLELLWRQMFSKSRCLVQEASTSWRTIFISLMGRNLSRVLWTIEINWCPFIPPWCGKFTPEVNLVFLMVFLLLVDARQLICVCCQNDKMSRKYLLLF